ncbi:hypothetical protein [Candidatus Nitrosocosmicus sp. SS]|jgi:hypothetical protein|uniref:hypothetical protein n=1 Tax=Candidatus Nitrosocosmicus agrestis TaxID=2563600 RepID=UPI00122E1EA4|nr:hypothetical protein [Candidatus Nitrosocosmicus sp. SS]KAA2283118.1 hypothetical protein F1Z66_03300 [Candidatus Nitrosocosmicus sp. SS]KAF0868574.1 hypothetical protein E5N71_09330 [Candidatus Nitrosocosmicus sp. SS]
MIEKIKKFTEIQQKGLHWMERMKIAELVNRMKVAYNYEYSILLPSNKNTSQIYIDINDNYDIR